MAKRTDRSKADDTTTATPPARPSSPGGERRSRSRAPRETGSTDEPARDAAETFAARREAADERPVDAPSDEEIRDRAYEIYLVRGGVHGMDFDDWVRAEQELRRKR